MLIALTVVITGLMAVYVAVAPQPESEFLPPGPSLFERWRARQAQHTLEEANTLDWIERVKDEPAAGPRPPWEYAPPPAQPAQSMLAAPAPPDGLPYVPWPPHMTDAHRIVRRALDYRPPSHDETAAFEPLPSEPGPEPEPLPEVEAEPETPWYLVEDEPEPEPEKPPAPPRAWQPGDPDVTIVKSVKQFTAELAAYEESLRYKDSG